MGLVRRAGFVLASACVLLVVAITAALAGFVPKVSTDYKSDGTASVLVNSRTAIRFLVSNGTLKPKERADITASRLKALVAQGVSPSSLTTKAAGKNSWIVYGDTNICLITPADAKANSSSVEGLASTWVSKLRTYLSMPGVDIKQKELLVPISETRTVEVGGACCGPMTARDTSPEITVSEVDNVKRVVTIRGKAVGDSDVVVSSDGESDSLTVHVRKYAGRLTQSPSIQITGNPAPLSLAGGLALTAVERSLQVETGASLIMGHPKMSILELNPGEKTVVQVPVRVSGGGHIPVTLTAPVEIINLRMDRKPVGTLLYSNNPESVSRYQTLFTGELPANQPTRLLYHHQNVIGKRFRFNLEIINPTDRTARLHIISAIADPIVDTVLVGYKAGSRFLRDYINQIGYVVDIPPNSKYIVYSDNVEPMKTASGILEFRELTGNQLSMRIAADLPGMADNRTGSIMPISESERNMAPSEDVYPTPNKQLTASYTVGERWTFIPVGKNAIKQPDTNKQLYGNYGVIYDIKVEISNPTATTKKVSVIFEPGAGLAGGVFFVDGRFVETKYVNPPNEFTIASYQLAPNQTKMVSILTVPLAGSAYPANILVKS